MGPWILGDLAAMTEDPIERRAALAEGEEILRKGAVGHNHIWFSRYAIDASLSSRDWDGVERYSTTLEEYARPEPLPWVDFFVRYGRALAAHGRGSRGQPMTCRLDDLVAEAERLAIGPALGPLRQALVASGCRSGQRHSRPQLESFSATNPFKAARSADESERQLRVNLSTSSEVT